MTLVFLGHDLSYNDNNEIESDGLFAVADSAITSQNYDKTSFSTLLSGFKKIYPLEIKVYKPSFKVDYDGGYFNGYHSIEFNSNGFLAIAGGTLVIQHIMNSINSHMQNLRISCFNTEYKIIRECQVNPLEQNSSTYCLNNTFVKNDYIGLNKAEIYFEHIKHSIETAIESAKPKVILNESDVKRIEFEIGVGLYCQVEKKYILKVFRCKSRKIDSDPDSVEYGFDVKTETIEKNNIATLGLSQYDACAKAKLAAIIDKSQSLPDEFFTFLNECIKNNISPENNNQRFAINYPSILYILEMNQLSKIKYFDGSDIQILKLLFDKSKFSFSIKNSNILEKN
ncbi:MAG: hypothetical protein PHC75_05165 [Burkholderiales bacterium]|nr:hypothetical protein [Burkholderiales bacterium]